MPDYIFEADARYTELLISTPFGLTTRVGYLLWARYVVMGMRASETFSNVVEVFAMPWAKHMAFVMGATEQDNYSRSPAS